MMPEPTTAARRNSVPTNSAAIRRERLAVIAGRCLDFFLDGELLQGGERQGEEEADSAVEGEKGIAKGALDLFGRALDRCGIGDAPVGGHRLAGPEGQTSLAALSQTVKTKSIGGARAGRTRPRICCAALQSRCQLSSSCLSASGRTVPGWDDYRR